MTLQSRSSSEETFYNGFYFSAAIVSEASENRKSFFQKLQVFWGAQYVYKSQTKTQTIRKASAEARNDQPSKLSLKLLSSKEVDNADDKEGEKKQVNTKKGIVNFLKEKLQLFLSIHWCLLVVIISIFISCSNSKACSGRFVNPITDICWSCLFPISIGPVRVNGGGREDTHNPSQIPCFCPKPPIPLAPGIPVGFWEPARLVDVTRIPFCMVSMGGLKMGNSTVGYGVHGANGDRQTQNSFYQVHWYVYPVIYWLELLIDFLCLEQQSFDVGYITELDPLWNADELSFILNPEAVLFGNPIAQAACAADCTAATAGFPLNSLFWCGGCQGSLYPFTGNNAAHNGGVQASLLMVQRMMAKLHRELLLWGTSGQEALCQKIPLPIIKKSQYKTQMTYPRPTTRGPMACNPLGRTEVIWGSGREFPYKGEDFGYLIWRKKNCCIL
ncbi:conjugal transfer pilus assembly protein TraU [Geitlerinema splendidum]|nr:conjugal transfer pilus assembly protein TraU [Geitlerinema splendidum]